MNSFINSKSFAIGLALFSMFFGAGNIIYPLALGQYAGDKNHFAIAGLLLTAAIMPIAGVIAMILFNGNYRDFFGRLGKIPGFLLALIVISLLGPLGSTPRCIALSYATLKSVFLNLSPIPFSAVACGIIFLFSFRRNHILALLGWVLTPLLLGSLLTIIILGLITKPEIAMAAHSNGKLFLHGLLEGYNTMDLLAAFFFSSTIVTILRMQTKETSSTAHCTIRTALGASLIGAILLGSIYIGFSYLAAFHGSHLSIQGKDEILAAISLKIAGAHAGMLVCAAIALACLTTAIALISSFTDFIQKEVFKERVSYESVLIVSLVLTFFISTFEFTGIAAFLTPILQICYPGLIVLTILNIAYSLFNFKAIKIPVFAAFSLSSFLYFFTG